MDQETLLNKYQALLAENKALREEIETLKARLASIGDSSPLMRSESVYEKVSSPPLIKNQENATCLNEELPPHEKIRLFISLFAGRPDVYAKRWENRQGKSGYSPVCKNEWQAGVCRKPAIKCADCSHRGYEALTDQVVEDHLRGRITVGIYPLMPDETCHFLAIDFDKDGWQKDVATLRLACADFDVPAAFERSRSGNGAHVWFFFDAPLSAAVARKFGSALLTFSMTRNAAIAFASYDRFFPNQDTMPKAGLGNLIALPLQKKARDHANSVFIDDNFQPYADQWGYLAGMRRLSEEKLVTLTTKLCGGRELGILRTGDEETDAPWESAPQSDVNAGDFPAEINAVRANMIFIPLKDISSRGQNAIKRLAAFKNPDFYKAQAMRLPTFNKPRIISCADEAPGYLCLPRGCADDLQALLNQAEVAMNWKNKTQAGRSIKVAFNGVLRDEQSEAVQSLLTFECGVLSAGTAFGKTVIAAKLIAERKVNTLVLVHRQQLLNQWILRLGQFLSIDEPLPTLENKRGRKKKTALIGEIGAGRNTRSGIVDVAVMQSLSSGGAVKPLVKDYGMVIVDECHHVPAFSFEQILKNVRAKYVHGLTATPARSDGHHPIIFMHCGPVRYRVDAKKQAGLRPFDHYIVPRFTSFKLSFQNQGTDYSIQEIYSEIAANEWRNRFIADDVVRCHKEGRHCLVLTERTSHVEILADMLKRHIQDVIVLTGGAGAKDKKAALSKIVETPTGQLLTLVATGKYIGEGFDEPRLDTLFLAMPISWRGTVQQYAGRLHRLFENKENVQIYDYVDTQVKVLAKMHERRLAGYASLGYQIKAERITGAAAHIIFDHRNYLPVYENDLMNVQKEILIVSPFVTKRRVLQVIPLLKAALQDSAGVEVLTRPAGDYKDSHTVSGILELLEAAGVKVTCKADIHQKFTIIDRHIVWYGSINLLGYGRSEETLIRLESASIAGELLKSL